MLICISLIIIAWVVEMPLWSSILVTIFASIPLLRRLFAIYKACSETFEERKKSNNKDNGTK